jgi:hypothetical protein
MAGNGTASADAPEQQDAARSGRDQGDGAPFPAFAPVNPEMFGNDLTSSPNTPCQHPTCNCAATATTCGAVEIAPAVCPICHGPRTERGRADSRRDVNIDVGPRADSNGPRWNTGLRQYHRC